MGTTGGRRFLLTGAMTRYPHNPSLDRPELAADVARITSLFVKQFGYTHVPLPGDTPTHDQLRDGLRRFAKAPDRRPDDLVVLYLACHGVILEPGEFVLLPSDIDPDDHVRLAVRPQALVDLLLRDTAVRRLLIMLDACYSGQGGQDAAKAAVKWVNQPGAVQRPGVVLITATHPWQQSLPGVFSRAFERAVASPATGGHAQEDLRLDTIVGVINADPETPASQSVTCHELGKTGRPPPFLPNPRFRRRLIDVDLLEQERAHYAEDRDANLRQNFLPATRWFKGRHAALTDLAEWLSNRSAGPRTMVVTGDAGSGKTALLGLLASLSDPDQAPGVPRDDLPPDFDISGNPIADAIYAGTLTTGQVRDRIAAAAGLQVETVQEFIDGLNQRENPLVVLIDAVDEAADPAGLISGLLRPLMSECAGTLQMLVGTRRHLLTARLLGTPQSGRYRLIDLDSDGYADPTSVRVYVRQILLAEDSLDSAYQPSGLYRSAPPGLLDAVTEAIGEAAGSSFLVARITATTEAAVTPLPNPRNPGWRKDLPRRAGQAMRRDLRLRLRGDAEKAAMLLLPLAYAQGVGLPWENIWPRLVEALSPGAGYSNQHLVWLRRTAGSYAVEGLADGRSAYRLYHQALVEHLLEGRDRRADQQAITSALITLVPRRAGGTRDWAAAHPYIRSHLATHAAQAGSIDDLLNDPAYLLNAAPPQLLASLGAAVSASARSAADAYRRASRNLRSKPAREHASYLQLAARCGQAPDLADALESHRHPATWSSIWASWQPGTPHDTLIGHTGAVSSVAGARLDDRPVAISGAHDATVRVWDLTSSAPAGDFTGHTDWVRAVAVTESDGRQLVISGGDDGSVRVWDLTSGAPACAPFTGHSGAVFALAAGELNGHPVVVSAGQDGTIRMWNLASGTPLTDPFTGHAGWIRALTVADLDGIPVVISGSDDRWIRVWDLASGSFVQAWRPGGAASALAAGELNGRPVAVSAGHGKELRVWDLASGSQVGAPYTGHTDRVRAVSVTDFDGRPVVISGASDTTVRVWDLSPGAAPAGEMFTGHAGEVNTVAVGQRGERTIVLSGGADRSVRAWDLASGGPVGGALISPAGQVRALAVGQRAEQAVVVWDDGSSLRQASLASLPSQEQQPQADTIGKRPPPLPPSPPRMPPARPAPPRRQPPAVRAPYPRASAPAAWPPRPARAVPTARPTSNAPRSSDPLPPRPPRAVAGGWPASNAPRSSGPLRPSPAPRSPWSAATPGAPSSQPSGRSDPTTPFWLRPLRRRGNSPAAPAAKPTVPPSSGSSPVVPPPPAARPQLARPAKPPRSSLPQVTAASQPPQSPETVAAADFFPRITSRPLPPISNQDPPQTPSARQKASAPPIQRPETPPPLPSHSRNGVWLPFPARRRPLIPGTVLALAAGELDGRLIAVSGDSNGLVRVWDLSEDVPAGEVLTGHSAAVRTVLLAKLRECLVVVSGGDDGSVRVWDLRRRRPVRRHLRSLQLRHSSPVHALAGYGQGHLAVVTGCLDGMTWVWDVHTARPLSGTAVPGGSRVSAVACFEPDQILCANGGALSLYSVRVASAPVLTIELGSDIQALTTHGRSVVAATRLGLVALEIPQ